MKCLALLLLFAAAGLRAEDGVLLGRVTAEPRQEKKVESKAQAYLKRAIQYVSFFDYDRLKNVVVYAERMDPGVQPAPAVYDREHTVTVKAGRYGLTVEPEFLTAPQQADVAFRNTAAVPVTLFAGGSPHKRFYLELAPRQEKKVRLDEPEFFHLFSLEDPGVHVALLVTSPYYTLADNSGRYRLNLPPGRYRVTAWHERLPPQRREMEILPGERQEMDFVLSVRDLPEVK